MFSALLATKRQISAICRGPLVSALPGGGKAFTLVELIATIAVVAMLAVALVVFIGGYIQDAKKTADRQTLAVLNDALTRYKTQGGSLGALTSGASIGNVLTKLQTAVTWAGMKHQFLKTGTTYTAASIGAIGEGQRYRFTKYGSFADGSVIGSDILETYADVGYDVGDEAAFDEWITQAMAETGTTNYLALTNPDTTDRFGIYARVANSGDKVRVWWGDGTTESFDSMSTSSSTVIAKNFGSSAARTIVIVGDISYFWSKNTESAIGGDGACNFGGNISTMKCLNRLDVDGANTLTGDVSELRNLTWLYCQGSNTLSGSVEGLTGLTHLNIAGSNTLSGSVTGLTSLTLLNLWGSNTLSGSVAGLTSLIYLNAHGSNTLSGAVTGLNSLTLLGLEGSNTCTGSVEGMSLQLLNLLGDSSVDVNSVVSVSGTATGLSYLGLSNNYTLNQAEVDTILANFWTNKDVAKPRNERFIDMDQANHATPSAAGLTTKANLQAYMSPNNTGPMVWTVNTN